ncbi:MAG: carbon-nitrogen hydrolase family protein [Oscillospiraceae bacterium]|nr:carbon-nitrogen hydrolase family protein [Oscillospiraceae bacterium]
MMTFDFPDCKITLAVCQMRTELDEAETLAKARRMVFEAADNGAHVVILPEMWSCPYDSKHFHQATAKGHGELVAAMASWAREKHILLVGGSIPELEDGKLYNTCFVFDEEGRQIARHRKVHLFQIDVPGMRFSEAATFTPGDAITTFETRYGTMGVAVCFDVRFPELFRAMAVRGAKIIFLPAQFNMVTGPAHWKMALMARALDNEVFMVGASAARYEGFSYECWGHSVVMDPYGEALAECDEKEQILYSKINLARVDKVRAQLPTFLHLRRDVYAVAE